MCECVCVVYQVVDGGALLSTAHVLEEAVVCYQQERTGVDLMVVDVPLLSQMGFWNTQRQSERLTVKADSHCKINVNQVVLTCLMTVS